jgi:hypothetical protein
MGERVERASLLAVGLLAGLVLAEAGLRLRALAIYRDGSDLARLHEVRPPAYDGSCGSGRAQSGLEALIQRSSFPELLYELKPDLDTCFYGAHIQTNAEGLRAETSFARPKPEGTYRIVLLGDSVLFGQGVEVEETLPELLRDRLARRSTRPVEVVNLGVDGYNTVQEAAALRHHGLSYEPDCVAVLYIGNDMELPAFLLQRPAVSDFSESFVLTLLRGRLERLRGGRRPGSFSPLVAAEPGRVPPAYRSMVGEDGYRRALASMVEALAPTGTPLVQLAQYSTLKGRTWRDLVAYQRSLGILVPEFHYPDSPELWLSETNRHFNPAGHRELTAQVIAAFEAAGVCLPPD